MVGHGKDSEAQDAAHVAPQEQHSTVLSMPPGKPKRPLSGYVNLMPWVKHFSFVHTYFVYVFTFYMFVLAFYKGYALYYPEGRQAWEMALIMCLPPLQHLRFFFGHWGNELGMPYDLAAFLGLCALTMIALFYFLFYQAYVMPLDTNYLTVAVLAIGVEGFCGIMNILQTMKLSNLTWAETMLALFAVFMVLATSTVFIVKELLPAESWEEHYYKLITQ
eukprot:TRINITY_DN103796_c0_g1_i1.p1 TRINITY_DN103796_c0_g1~~TRINITY_DN103796_c0_g1_i1.p1  ORF type:complete len:219 (-),score=34.09 TRINITY_DN103796_c0_g1_i1:115-771(-)